MDLFLQDPKNKLESNWTSTKLLGRKNSMLYSLSPLYVLEFLQLRIFRVFFSFNENEFYPAPHYCIGQKE